MTEVSSLRLWLMRAMYAIIVAGLGLFVWPSYLAAAPDLPLFTGTALTMLAAFSILCAIGIRYPLRMLPILLWELLWKSMWLLVIALPRWLDGTLDEGMRSTVFDTSLGLILIFVIPWRYVWANYVARPGDPWALRRSGSETAGAAS